MSNRPSSPADFVAALVAAHVTHWPLIKLEFEDETTYLCGLDFSMDFDGQTWSSTRGLISLEEMVESSDGDVTGIKITLAGVRAEDVADALTEPVQGRPCTVLWATLKDGAVVVDPLAWKGRMDVMGLSRPKGSRTISVTAENPMADWQRPREILFNDAGQRRIDPTDSYFVGIETIERRDIVLFSKEVQQTA